MKRSINSLIGFTLGATDGEIGKVKELYFDDETWTIRYLIFDTGNWLSGRLVLLSPESLLAPDWEKRIFIVNLTKEQIANSPDINTDIPVSRQEEIKLYQHYPWTAYWGAGYYGSDGINDIGIPGIRMPILQTEAQEAQQLLDEDDQEHDKHLRSTAKVTGYTIHATDGKIGDVEDFLVDDTTWKIDFMMIDTGHWFPGKKVLIATNRIMNIDWKTSAVFINATVDHVKSRG